MKGSWETGKASRRAARGRMVLAEIHSEPPACCRRGQSPPFAPTQISEGVGSSEGAKGGDCPRVRYSLRATADRRYTFAALSGVLLALVALGWAPRAVAQTNLRTLFPQQAPIYVTSGSLSRLDLPVDVLSACRPDLSDLRIFDAQGNEVAYLLDSGPAPDSQLEVLRRYPFNIAEMNREREDREQGPSIFREQYVLEVPADVTASDSWDLIVETRQPQYVRRIRVSADDGGSQTLLIDDGSLFRLSNPRRERNRLTLPRFSASRLAVAIEGEDDAYLEPVFHLESSRAVHSREQARVELRLISRQQDGRRTVVELERPRGLRAESLVLATSSAAFSRVVEVWDEGPGAADEPRGRKELYRVQAAATVEDLSLALSPAAGDRLRVVIHNGDSPPLADLVFTAVAPRPSLLFSLAPQGGETPSGMLRFGGGRAYRPQYDLQRLGPLMHPPRQGEQAQIAEQLVAEPALARLGEISGNPEFNPAPVLAFAMRPGGPIDSRMYTHQRAVRLDPSEEGLARLKLTIEDLAQAQPDLNDVRILDSSSRQWAYLLERGAGYELRALEVTGPETADGFSEYELLLPVTPVTFDQIEIATAIEFFDREFELTARREETEFPLARGRLSRRAGDPRPVTIVVEARRVDSLKLKIHDGDDAPLELSRVEARFPTPEIYVAAPTGEYTLLVGNPEDQPPAYELAQVRETVLAVRSSEAQIGPLEVNPEFSASARLVTGGGPQQVLLWVALIVVVGALSVVTLRMVRQHPADEAGPPGKQTGPPDGGESS